MSCFTPNFYDVFLTRYCRDKLACTIPCKPVNTCPGTDASAVYPHINRALRQVYTNQKISNFNCAYHTLATYLEQFPEEMNKINAILWKWIEKKGKKPSRFNCKPIEYCGCEHNDEFIDLDPESSSLPINIQNKVTNPANPENSWCRCQKCDDTPNPCECEHPEDGLECNRYRRHYDHKKTCDNDCKYRSNRRYCGVDKLDCEPRCGPKVEYEVPEPMPICDHLPCTNNLKRDLTDVVPHCLKKDRKLQYLIADVVRYFL